MGVFFAKQQAKGRSPKQLIRFRKDLSIRQIHQQSRSNERREVLIQRHPRSSEREELKLYISSCWLINGHLWLYWVVSHKEFCHQVSMVEEIVWRLFFYSNVVWFSIKKWLFLLFHTEVSLPYPLSLSRWGMLSGIAVIKIPSISDRAEGWEGQHVS